MKEGYPSEEGSDLQKSVQLYGTVVSAALTACGLMCMAGGVVCMGAIRRGQWQQGKHKTGCWQLRPSLMSCRGEKGSYGTCLDGHKSLDALVTHAV